MIYGQLAYLRSSFFTFYWNMDGMHHWTVSSMVQSINLTRNNNTIHIFNKTIYRYQNQNHNMTPIWRRCLVYLYIKWWLCEIWENLPFWKSVKIMIGRNGCKLNYIRQFITLIRKWINDMATNEWCRNKWMTEKLMNINNNVYLQET